MDHFFFTGLASKKSQPNLMEFDNFSSISMISSPKSITIHQKLYSENFGVKFFSGNRSSTVMIGVGQHSTVVVFGLEDTHTAAPGLRFSIFLVNFRLIFLFE